MRNFSKLVLTSLTSICLFFGLGLVTQQYSVLAAPPAKAFGELPVAYDAAISPDGSYIAVIINVAGEYRVLTKPMNSNDSKDAFFVPLGEDIFPSFIKWVNDDRWIVAIRKLEKYRTTPYNISYLFTVDRTEQKGRLVVKPKDMFRQNNARVADWLEDDPDHILMQYSDVEFDAYPDLKKVHVATGRDKTVLRGRNGITNWISDSEGMPRIGWGTTEGGDERLIIFNPETEKWDSSNEYPGLSYDTPIYGMLNQGTDLVIGDYNNRDTIGVYVYNLAAKKISRSLFHNDDYDASNVVLSKDGETVIGVKYTADRDKVELLSEYGTLLDRLRAKYSDYTVEFVDQTADGDTVIVNMSAPYDPGGMYIYNAKDKQPSRLTRMYRGFSDSDMGNVVSVRYTARDGEKIPGFVTLPPTIEGGAKIKNLPFIVLPHGGPYARDAKQFDYLAQFFATRGYGVLQMNFRGSDGYGKAFADAGRSNWIVMQEDVEDGMRWLLDKGYADPNRSCIAGWSYGGYAALMGVAKDPELYKCAIAMAALTDIEDAKRDLRKYRGGKHAAKEFFGEAMQDKATRRDNSPTRVADQIKVPVFLAHGDRDINVQFDQFTRMKKALNKAGVKATYMTFKDEDHYLSKQKHREQFLEGVEKFLIKVNGKSEYMAP